MELVERYLQAIGFWLPASQRQDILAELSEDIHAQLEEREAAIGHPLTKDEVEETLRQRGAPILVANRFLPQRSLIGPLLFPIYLFVLKVVGFFYMLSWAVVMLCIVIFTPHGAVANGLDEFKGFLLHGIFIPIGVITLAFAILERTQTRTRFLEKWNPTELPPVVNPNKIKRFDTAVEAVVGLIFAWWWFTAALPFASLHIFHLTLTFAPSWGYFWWGYLFIALANTVLAAINFMRPWWTPLRAAARFVSSTAGSVLMCWLFRANILASMSAPSLDPRRAAEITLAFDEWAARIFPAAVIVCVFIAAVDIHRIVRVARARSERGPNAIAPNQARPHP